MKVAVIGSPVLASPREVRQALKACLAACEEGGGYLAVVTGGARNGAEDIAFKWAKERHERGEHVEHPATLAPRWHEPCRTTCRENHRRPDDRTPGRTVCPSAPFYRNAELVDDDTVDVFLVWVADGFRAAVHMAELVEKSGRLIQVFR